MTNGQTPEAGSVAKLAEELKRLIPTYGAACFHYEDTADIAGQIATAIDRLAALAEQGQRDSARYRWLRDEAWSGEHSGKRLPHVVVFKPGLMPSAVLELAEEALDEAIDAALNPKDSA